MKFSRIVAAIAAAAAFVVPAGGQVALGYMQTSAANLTDSSGNKIANATIAFAPVDNNGKPISYQVNGSGQAHSLPVTTLVTAGAMSIVLADTSLTIPVNVCFSVTITDNVSGKQLLGPGYECFQPAGAGLYVTNAICTAAAPPNGGTCNFDKFPPNLAGQVLVQNGPTGPPGPVGPIGPPGPGGTPPGGASGELQMNSSGVFGSVRGSSVDGSGNVKLPGTVAASTVLPGTGISKDNSAPITSASLGGWPPANVTNQYWNSCWLNIFVTDPICGTTGGTMGPFTRMFIANAIRSAGNDQYQTGQFHLDAVTGGVNQSTPSAQKSNFGALWSTLRSYTPGQHFAYVAQDMNASNGDTFGLYAYAWQYGNTNAAGDEGHSALVGNAYQGNAEFNATVSSVAGNVINYTGASSDEPYSRGEQRLLINTTTGVYSTGTITTIAGTPPTVTGSGTAWSTLGAGAHSNLCFQLDGGNASNSFLYVLQINSIVSDTSLTLVNSNASGNSAWQGDATTGTYKIYKCSVTTAIARTGAVTVADGTQFTFGDVIRMPIGAQLLTIGAKVQIAHYVPGGGGNIGILINNNLSNSRIADQALSSAGNFKTMWQEVGATNVNRTWFVDQSGPATLWNVSGEGGTNTLSLLSVNRAVSGGNYVESYGEQFDLRLFNGAGTYRFMGLSATQARFDVDTSGGIPTFYVDSGAANSTYINNGATLNFQSGNQSGNTASVNAATGIASFNGVIPKTLYSAAGTVLPACGASIKGELAVVSDATSPTYMGTYTSGGTITAAVICSYNGTTYAWITH